MEKYTINNKTWIQRPLVLGQIQQLLTVIKGMSIPRDAGVLQLIEAVGDRIPVALAIVLVEEGKNVAERVGIRLTLQDGVMIPEWYQNPDKLAEIASELFAGMTAETIVQVVTDFLECNPVNGILDQLTGLINKGNAILPLMAATGLKPSSASYPEEISPDGPASSGDSPLKSASPT